MYRHHTFEERLSIVSRIVSGEPLTKVCREQNINMYMVLNGYLDLENMEKKVLRGHVPIGIQLKIN